MELRDRIALETDQEEKSFMVALRKVLCIRNDTVSMLKLVDRAIELVQSYRVAYESQHKSLSVPPGSTTNVTSSDVTASPAAIPALPTPSIQSRVTSIGSSFNTPDYFYYQEFHFYHIRIEHGVFWFRPGLQRSVLIILAFYFLTPILFCHISYEPDICPNEVDGKPYPGWLTAIYFGSVTLSTVGYGNITVQGDSDRSYFVGAFFMLLANITLITAMGQAIASSMAPLEAFRDRLHDWIFGDDDGEMVWVKIRRLRIILIIELLGVFFLLTFVGVVSSQVYSSTLPMEERWSFMKSTYWVIQTSLTVGE